VVIMTRNGEAKRNGYSANSYLAVLDQTIERCWQPGMTFIQDNAPIHTVKKVAAWFKDRAMPVLDWAPYSPDSNPIEHVWANSGSMSTIHSLRNWGDRRPPMMKLARVIVEAGDPIPQDYIDGLIKSMDSRINAVREAEGWHTKY
jgi:DDE superfamily endonuclease